MYGGRPGYGGQLPYSLGERSDAPMNLAGSPYGGAYLEGLFEDISRVAKQVGIVSSELDKVATGKATVATIPTGQASLTLPVGNTGVSTAIPLWAVGAVAAGLLYLAFRPRR